MAAATPETLYEYIRSVSYPNNKAKHLAGLARMLVEEYHGQVPSELKELTRLPGVGRKTANVVQAVAFEKSHHGRGHPRIPREPTHRAGPFHLHHALQRGKATDGPLPPEIIPKAHHWLILHGRYTCTARAPKCDTCGLKMLCRYYRRNNGNPTPAPDA